jgi:hypothetical protein
VRGQAKASTHQNIEKIKKYTKSNINTNNLKHLEKSFFCPEYL